MKPEQAKLKRLQRLERVRAIAKQTAAGAAARAEGTLAQLEALAIRTNDLAADYSARRDAGNGAELRQVGVFARGLQGIRVATEGDVARARLIADRRQLELAAAERRRAAVEERVEKQARDVAAKVENPALGSRVKGFGTELE